MSGTTMRNLKIETSTDGGKTWVDASGVTNSITVDGGEREIGTFFDAQNDTPTLGAGKRAELELKIRVKYTEQDDDGYGTFARAYEDGSEVMVRYSRKGGALIADTALPITITLTSTESLSTGFATLQICLSHCRLDGELPKSNRGQQITTSVRFTALSDGTNPPIIAVLRTADTAL